MERICRVEAKDNPWVKTFRWLATGLAVILALELVFILWSNLVDVQSNREETLELEGDGLKVNPLPPVGEFQDVVERTLFSWSRSPPRSMRESATPDANELSSEWLLTGLVNTGESTYAIFSEIDGDRQVRLEEGMEIGDWIAGTIDAEKIVLSRGEKSEVYRLSVTKNNRIKGSNTLQKPDQVQRDEGTLSAESREPKE